MISGSTIDTRYLVLPQTYNIWFCHRHTISGSTIDIWSELDWKHIVYIMLANISCVPKFTSRKTTVVSIFKVAGGNIEFNTKWRQNLVHIITKARIIVCLCFYAYLPAKLLYFPLLKIYNHFKHLWSSRRNNITISKYNYDYRGRGVGGGGGGISPSPHTFSRPQFLIIRRIKLKWVIKKGIYYHLLPISISFLYLRVAFLKVFNVIIYV